MTLYTLFGIIAASALVLVIIKSAIRQPKSWLVAYVSAFVGSLFVFSGVIKAIDPIGTAIKMEEYFEIFTEYVPFLDGLWHFMASQALPFSVFMIVLEIFLGIALLLGVYINSTIWLLIAIIVFFTALTGFSHITGKVTDCGCFGDFIKLTPFQSFIKDVVLLVLILFLLWQSKKILKNIFGTKGQVALWILTIASLAFSIRNIRNMPVIDFRAYAEGVNIPDCLTLPEDAKPFIYQNVFIYKNKATGENKEFVDTYPTDFENWEFVDRIDKLLQKGDEPKCKDFSIMDADGSDWSEEFLYTEKPIMFITSYDLSKASQNGLKKIADLTAEAAKNGMEVIMITGSSLVDAEKYRHEYGLAFDVFNTDGTPIKTINRSNPGVMILQNGTILKKYHWRHLPTWDMISKAIE